MQGSRDRGVFKYPQQVVENPEAQKAAGCDGLSMVPSSLVFYASTVHFRANHTGAGVS